MELPGFWLSEAELFGAPVRTEPLIAKCAMSGYPLPENSRLLEFAPDGSELVKACLPGQPLGRPDGAFGEASA